VARVSFFYLPIVTHTLKRVSHRFFSYFTPSDLRFCSLSTDSKPGYYYYLYIQETLPQTNYTSASSSKPGLILNSESVDAFPRKEFYKTEKMRMRAAA
jgi:hypothetical protein